MMNVAVCAVLVVALVVVLWPAAVVDGDAVSIRVDGGVAEVEAGGGGGG